MIKNKQSKSRIYIGYFENDKFEGEGELENYDGAKYEGMFKNWDLFGNGKLTYPSG
jgi:hypothetical protein